MPWRIELFGSLRVGRGAGVITRFRTRKTGALLAYLAYHASRLHTREELIERFWPGYDVDAARNSLRVALNALRRQFDDTDTGLSLLQADHTHITLNPAAFTTDVGAFEAALDDAARFEQGEAARTHLAAAVRLYGGPLLRDEDEDWIAPERQRLADAYVGALRRLVKCCVQSHDFEEAIDYARRAVAADPLREDQHRLLIRLLVADGRPAAALEQFRSLEQGLQAALGVSPSRTTRELVTRLLHAQSMEAACVPAALQTAAPVAGIPRAASPDTASSPASYPPIAAERDSLPAPFAPFFGREEEIAQLAALLSADEANPLVTLIGVGGSGKTRLAIEVARRLRQSLPRAVWFVALADLTDPRHIADAICQAMRLERAPDRSALEQAVEALSQQPSLLVLDNFEHLLTQTESGTQDGAAVLQELRNRVASLLCFVTSRQRLNLPGEREYPLTPLPLPPPTDRLEQLQEYACVRLFVNRAQAVHFGFHLHAHNAADVAALCRCLEGIPLAIELAAGWAHTLTPRQIRMRLSHRLDLLVGGSQGQPPRHLSLRAAIDWSYRLLPAPLQQLFVKLSVFRGDWAIEAAEAICAEPRGLEYLRHLRERSLVTSEERNDTMRFRLLEMLREFAAEQLTEAERDALAARHADYYLHLAEQTDAHCDQNDFGLWLKRQEDENDNLRAAHDYYLKAADGALPGLRLAAALSRLWRFRGYVSEGRERLRAMLAREGAEHPTYPRAKALNHAGVLAALQGDRDAALAYYQECLHLFRNLGDERSVGGMLNNLANITRDSGDYAAAMPIYAECLVISRKIGYTALTATALMNLADNMRHQRDEERARTLYAEALALFRALNHPEGIATALCKRAAIAEGDEAQALYAESLALFREIGEKEGIAFVLGHLADLYTARNDGTTALALYEESMLLARELGDRRQTVRSLIGLAQLALAQEDAERAAYLLGAAERLRETIGGAQPPEDTAAFERTLSQTQGALDAPRFADARAEGCAATLEQVLAHLSLACNVSVMLS
jgi:predicted ATPase/DNA-binding SARP family transcriptional activator